MTSGCLRALEYRVFVGALGELPLLRVSELFWGPLTTAPERVLSRHPFRGELVGLDP